MSHTATAYETPAFGPATVENAMQVGETLLDRIVSRLEKILRHYHAGKGIDRQSFSFVDANLTDPVLGPEIRRALR